jgi:hypothetical protein
MLNTSRAEKGFGFKAKVGFEEGLRKHSIGIFQTNKLKKREKPYNSRFKTPWLMFNLAKSLLL